MKKNARIWVAILLFLFLIPTGLTAKAVETSPTLDDLYIEVGDALMKVKDKDWEAVKTNLQTFEAHWEKLHYKSNNSTKEIEQLLKDLNKLLEDPQTNTELIIAKFTTLSKSLVVLDKELNPTDQEGERLKLAKLTPILELVEKELNASDFSAAKQNYEKLLTKWTELEVIVRDSSVATYGAFETQMAYIRIALEQEPADKEKALTSIAELNKVVNDFVAGKETASSLDDTYSLSDVTLLLQKSMNAIEKNATNDAIDQLNQILLIWPTVEGEVRTKDSSLYNQVENEVPLAISLLSSKNKDEKKALELVKELEQGLSLVATKTNYTFVDALMILLREGLEAILVITGLIAFLKKTNHGDKQRWIWGGAIGGVFASVLLAYGINMFLSTVTAASSREYLEGIIGIVAVIMMLTVGAWLHKRTSTKMWNKYVHENLGKALAKGSLISMATLSFLSIFREGAETIIFFAGMAPSIETSQLTLGIVLALALLMVIGYLIIRYSTIIPLRPFFMVATMLIYVLAFKMIGVSIHALQVATVINIHSIPQIPFIEAIGLYPTWETLIPQAFVILIIIGTSIYVKTSTEKLMVPAQS